jgi:hypothetical protein
MTFAVVLRRRTSSSILGDFNPRPRMRGLFSLNVPSDEAAY